MHTCVTALLFVLDISWIGAEMRRPGWDGMPDMDIAFMMGYLMRVFLFNVLLAIVGWYAIRRKSAMSLSADQP